MMHRIVDMMGRSIDLPKVPNRIISLVPSQTELLYDLDLNERVVGITKFCIHPKSWFTSKQRIGGTKSINFETIAALQPDLIIANKEENTKDEIEELSKKYPVWISDISTLESSLEMIRQVGFLTQTESKAFSISEVIQEGFNEIISKTPKKLKVAYCIWKNPWMFCGGDTFVNDIIEKIGLDNCIKVLPRYPIVELEELQQYKPDILWLSSEPFPFKEKHLEEIQQHFPKSKIQLVDGEMFSWYGSRMVHSIKYLKELVAAL
jgi:ABC-type Fe3+-hydroxamate transport system substrate-binding protein